MEVKINKVRQMAREVDCACEKLGGSASLSNPERQTLKAASEEMNNDTGS